MEVGEQITHTGHRISLSKHGLERYCQRWPGVKQRALMAAYAAFEKGRNLTEEEYKKVFEMGLKMERKGYLSGTYRVYKNFLFVFQRGKKTHVLITIIPYHSI